MSPHLAIRLVMTNEEPSVAGELSDEHGAGASLQTGVREVGLEELGHCSAPSLHLTVHGM